LGAKVENQDFFRHGDAKVKKILHSGRLSHVTFIQSAWSKKVLKCEGNV